MGENYSTTVLYDSIDLWQGLRASKDELSHKFIDHVRRLKWTSDDNQNKSQLNMNEINTITVEINYSL